MQLRITKCSQYQKDSLVWQASFLGKEANLPEKFYLLISYHKERGEYVHFLRERPVLNWQASGVFAALVRKHLSTAVISEILADEEGRNLWLPLKHQAQEWWIHIQHEGAVEVSLISPEGESLIRLGAKGIFTKRKIQELPIGLRSSLHNRMAEFVKMLDNSEQRPKVEQAHATSENKENLELSFFQREGRRRLARKLKTVRQALQKLQKERTSDEELKVLEKHAQFLQVFIHEVKAGANSLLLAKESIGEEADLRIPLDKERSAGQNLSAIFERLKKEKQSRLVWQNHLAKVEQELRSLEEEIRKFDTSILREDEVTKSLHKFNLSVEKPKAAVKLDQSTLPYKIFKSSEGVDILVGKGSHENDEMTKAARSNDHWFHAIGLGGSHIIVPSQKQGVLSTKTKREAAILALHFSKVRKDLGGEVYVTKRGSLTKKKGMPPGLWSVQQAETFYLTYTEEELKALLANR